MIPTVQLSRTRATLVTFPRHPHEAETLQFMDKQVLFEQLVEIIVFLPTKDYFFVITPRINHPGLLLVS